MTEAASIYIGTHDFRCYTARPQKGSGFTRSIGSCKIEINHLLSANFFPEKSYVLTIRSAGFLRYQVRMIMGALIQLGKGVLTIDDLRNSLQENSAIVFTYIAPGSGLMLQDLDFERP
jgi:tRNA pseudouridine38-40 synthase